MSTKICTKTVLDIADIWENYIINAEGKRKEFKFYETEESDSWQLC